MSIKHRWIVPTVPFSVPKACGHCIHAPECRRCAFCGNDVHVVEDYAPNGQCHCGRTPVKVVDE